MRRGHVRIRGCAPESYELTIPLHRCPARWYTITVLHGPFFIPDPRLNTEDSSTFFTLAEIKALSVDDRIRLLEAIWDSITSEPGLPEMIKTRQDELLRRVAAHKASPDDVVPWEEVKAQALERSRR